METSERNLLQRLKMKEREIRIMASDKIKILKEKLKIEVTADKEMRLQNLTTETEILE